MRTQVGIVGGGPAGLLLAQLLGLQGIDSVVVETRSRSHVEGRVRAGVIEQGAVDVLTAAGVGDRLNREGLRHDGIHLQWPGERARIDFVDLCGRSVWVYGQTELTKDLVSARVEAGQPIYWSVSGTTLAGIDGDRPTIAFVDEGGVRQVVECDLVAGCDGFHGVSRPTIPDARRRVHERAYPYSWLGILAEVAPSSDELIYAWHPDGFALHSLRSERISRFYLQVDQRETIDRWSDDRVWDALATRFALDGWSLQTGPVLEKSITPMRSFVSAPMRHGRLFLAGDAAHIVPPTGAKGLNLAIADVSRLAAAMGSYLRTGSEELIDGYSDAALRRVWQATHFSWWMTTMLHPPADGEPDAEFVRELQLTQLRYVTSSRTGAAWVAENYTGAAVDALGDV